ncbi:hypothetical protein BMT54_01620 [Pasteurellaceae bacterium 15-036681]|nr:hypothetical protein BMT54_01620 [Pasteurellaceae bacterium 15-036681]
MKKLLTALMVGLLALPVMAKPVKNIEQAIELVERSIIKNKLTELPIQCLMFIENDVGNDFPYHQIDVREKHNQECGGDPETAPRLFSYSVNKKKGFLKTDAIWREDGEEFSGILYPIDPISPVILYEKGKERKLKYFVRGSGREIK